ncbi:hypothetical protein AVEN_244253-1 [Araneus ventricosus]|uniref:Uncharacterized protein n=1 Tax=Araneus ventricosus TaxID=182803 RepID=A0A4Y2PNA9_ARAVE|nr:hypothetical protein AVEN_244253-1 [Araneus ventricosus]
MDPKNRQVEKASKGQSSEEESQSKMPTTVAESSEEGSQRKLLTTVEEVISADLFSAADKARCAKTCERLKKEVRYETNALINILRERELDLCIEIENEYSAQVQKIDHDVTANCADKIMKRYDENKRAACKNTLIFNSDFHVLRRRLKNFGQLKYEDTLEHAKKRHQEFLETSKRRDSISARSENAPSALYAGIPFEIVSKTTSRAEDRTPLSFVSPFEMGSKVTPLSSASPIEVDSIAEHRIANGKIFYGGISYLDTLEELEKCLQENLETSKVHNEFRTQAEDALSADSQFEIDFKATSMAENAALMSSASPVKVDNIAEHRIANEENDRQFNSQKGVKCDGNIKYKWMKDFLKTRNVCLVRGTGEICTTVSLSTEEIEMDDSLDQPWVRLFRDRPPQDLDRDHDPGKPLPVQLIWRICCGAISSN